MRITGSAAPLLAAGLLSLAGPRAASAQPDADEPDAEEGPEADDEQDAAPAPGASSFTVTIPPERATLERHLRFQTLTRDDGLPQSTVNSIVQDATGFIWLGTQDGIARYDGQRIVVFRHDPNDPSSLSSSFINTLLVASDGTLWVGTEGGGVNRYDPASSSFEHFPASEANDTLNSGSILALSEGPEGKIWVGTNGGGLGVLDPESGEVRSYAMEDGLIPVVPAVHVDQDGIAWVGTASGMFRFDPEEGIPDPLFQGHETLATATISVLTPDEKGRLWIGTAGSGLVRYDPNKKKHELYEADPDDPTRLNDSSIKTVYQDRSGRLWVGTDQMLHLLDSSTGDFERHASDPEDSRSLPGPPLDIFEDAAGVLWVATFAGGAAMLDPRSLKFHNYKAPGVSALHLDGKDLWVATGEGICRWRGNLSFQGICYELGFSTSVLVDREGTLWVGTMADGLLRLKEGSDEDWVVYQSSMQDPTSVAPGPIPGLYEDRKGRLWIGLIGGGLQRYDRERDAFVNVELPSDLVNTVRGDPKRDDVLWIGTGNQGLIRLDVESGKTKAFTPKPDDPENKTDNSVLDFYFADEKTVWIATFGGGLKRLDLESGEFQSYRRADGIPSDTLYAVRPGKEGRLWLSSIAGLARFDPETDKVQVFTKADGLQSDEFAQNAFLQADDGRLFFGGINGFNMFHPGAIQIDGYQPPVVLTSIEILGERLQTDDPLGSLERLSLDHDEAFVAVEFAALSYSGSDKLQFEYKVEGASDRWLSTDSAVVSLAGLDDGDYDLLLRARTRHGTESELRKLKIHVNPPLWRTWWAYSGYGVAFVGLLFGVYRYQQVRVERLEKLARLATVEHEFDVTAAVQSWFLPGSTRFTRGDYELVGFYRAADKCSGDWWWYEDLAEGKLWVLVADVTGHGAGPAMVTAAVAMGLGVQADADVIQEEDLNQRLARVNREVLSRCKRKAHMTMTGVVLDLQTGEINVQGLGGLPALRMEPDGKHRVIGPRGTPLGSSEDLEVGERAAQLNPGDRLLLMTDGIVETMLPNQRPLGMRRFVKIMRETRNKPLEQAAEQLVREVDILRETEPQEDDFTFCLIQRRG